MVDRSYKDVLKVEINYESDSDAVMSIFDTVDYVLGSNMLINAKHRLCGDWHFPNGRNVDVDAQDKYGDEFDVDLNGYGFSWKYPTVGDVKKELGNKGKILNMHCSSYCHDDEKNMNLLNMNRGWIEFHVDNNKDSNIKGPINWLSGRVNPEKKTIEMTMKSARPKFYSHIISEKKSGLVSELQKYSAKVELV